MLIEMHAHTSRHSKCSSIDPVALVRQVVRQGLQGVVLTEHHYLWNDEEIRRLRTDAEVDYTFLIFTAQEVDTEFGHVLVYGGSRTVPERMKLQELRDLFPDAALVWAHPFRHGKLPPAEKLTDPRLDALEVFSLNQSVKENYTGLTQWHKYKFTATCGSDVHSSDKAGRFPTQFDHPVSTIEELASEVRHARCRPLFKEIPKAGSDMSVIEISIGTKGEDEHRHRIIVRKIPDIGKWNLAKQSSYLTEELYRSGFHRSVYRVPAIIEVNDREHLIIEEGQRGRNLYDTIANVTPATGQGYYALAAQWLAALHRLRLASPDAVNDTINRERGRFVTYEQAFAETGSPYLEEAKGLIAFVRDREEDLFRSAAASFVRIHGDYHPKNIIIGQDRSHDPKTLFITVIDFNNSLVFCPAFDVGYFLAQFRTQFNHTPDILNEYTDRLFIEEYRRHSPGLDAFFEQQVDFFRIRGYLSIAAFLIRMGKGQSPVLQDLMHHAQQLKSSLLPTFSHK